MTSKLSSPSYPHYVAFDKVTGRIVGAYHQYDSAQGKNVAVPLDELGGIFAKDSSLIADLTNKDAGNLDVLEVHSHMAHGHTGPSMVDVKRRSLVAQPRIALTSSKRELRGDGVDSATIEIKVIGADGHVARNVSGPVKVTTTRGKLSTHGGVVVSSEGVGSITLTSVAETVSRVQVRAVMPNGLCAPGAITLEFA